MSWKDWPAWLKGGVIFDLFIIILFIVFEVMNNLLPIFYKYDTFLFTYNYLILFFSPVWHNLFFGGVLESIISLVFYFLIGAIIGALIGWIYGKIKKK